MRLSKFTPEQVVRALRQIEAGTVVVEVCRKLGVTAATFYRRKKTHAGLDLHELRELRQQDTSGAPAGGWYPGERMTPEEPVRGYTVWSAYAGYDEQDAGTVMLTVSRGRVTFQR